MSGTTNIRIARNTIILFVRMFIVMTISLFTVRLTLKALGAEDYGIYNVVAGFVAMFSCVSSVLATATQRYYSFYLGVSDTSNLSKIYSASLIIYFIYSAVVLVAGETIGLWFLNTHLVIPETRLFAANIIYQFAIVSFIISILIVPFSAAVIAHENFSFFALVSLLDCFLKFGLVFLLKFLTPDKLILYGTFLLIVQLLNFVLYYQLCKRKYSECRFIKVRDKQTYKDLVSFSGWTLFGSIAGMGMMQVNTILVNIFFGPIVNASRAIALHIHSAILNLSNNFIMAVRPPMIKNYADGQYEELNYLFNLSNKIIFLLMSVCCVPLVFEMPFILKIWLGDVSRDTLVFSQLMIIYTFLLSFSNPITIIMQAMGRVKEYFVPVEIITLLCAPITYVLFRLGLPAETTFISMIACIIVSHLIRLDRLKKFYSGFSLKNYVTKVVLLFSFILIVTIVAIIYIRRVNMNPWVELIAVIGVTVLTVGGMILFIAMDKQERRSLIKYLKREN